MKNFASFLVMAKAPKVAMGMLAALFLTVNFAQAQNADNIPAPATLTSADSAQIARLLPTSLHATDSIVCAALLQNGNTPIVTRVAQTGTLCGVEVLAGDSVKLYIVKIQGGFNVYNNVFYRVPTQVTVEDRSQVAALDSAAIHSQFVEKQLEGRPRYRTEFVADQHDISDGRIIAKASDKFGLSLLGGGTYQMGDGLNSFSGEAGFNYSIANASGRWFVMPELLASLRLTKYNDNANNAGEKYWSYGTEATAFGGVALGTHGCHRIAVGAGLGWEHYKTDSQARYYEDGSWDEMSSEGNYIYPQAKIRYMYDMYNGPLSFFAGVGVRQHKSVWQNSDSEKSWMPTFELGISLKLFRHLNNNK